MCHLGAILALISMRHFDSWRLHQELHLREAPRGGVSWMFVEEISSTLNLLFVQLHDKFHVHGGLRQCASPGSWILRFAGVEKLPCAEGGAHRRADEHVRALPPDDLPGLGSFGQDVEIPWLVIVWVVNGDVEGHPRDEMSTA